MPYLRAVFALNQCVYIASVTLRINRPIPRTFCTFFTFFEFLTIDQPGRSTTGGVPWYTLCNIFTPGEHIQASHINNYPSCSIYVLVEVEATFVRRVSNCTSNKQLFPCFSLSQFSLLKAQSTTVLVCTRGTRSTRYCAEGTTNM